MQIPNTKSPIEAAVALKTSVARVLKMIAEKKLDAINMNEGGIRPRWAIPDAAVEALASPKPAAIKRKIPRHV